jgi:hypothetical protein
MFYNHPMVKYLGENRYNSKPSYITKETFSKVMIDLLHGDDINTGDDIKPVIEDSIREGKLALSNIPIGKQTLRYIRSVWIDAQGDVDVFRKSLEQWFDDTMERCSGWYKKYTQYILLILGLLIAIIFNVNTIEIIGKLEKDPALRESIVQQADAFTKAHPDLYQERVTGLNANKNFTVAYSKQDSLALKNKLDSVARAKNDSLLNNGLLGTGIGSYSFKWTEWTKILSSILGWLITALALSLGAPFWFDLLNKLMKLRSSLSISTSAQSKGKENDTTTVNRKG